MIGQNPGQSKEGAVHAAQSVNRLTSHGGGATVGSGSSLQLVLVLVLIGMLVVVLMLMVLVLVLVQVTVVAHILASTPGLDWSRLCPS